MPPKRKAFANHAQSKSNKASRLAHDDNVDDDDIMAIQEHETAPSLAAMPPPPIPSEPVAPILQSYTYASPIPSECSKIDPCNPSIKVPCVLGVDEAGRGPVLGPLVYGIAYCPVSYQDDLKQIGFADSKALTAERRDSLLSALIDQNSHLGWAVRVMSPQDISAGMLRRRPINLNAQSSQATVSLIAGVLESGVDLTEIYVDTVGDPKSYSKLLSSYFPRHSHIKWTVTSKADAIYPIVGAASIAAKVTRDRCVDAWRYAEQQQQRLPALPTDAAKPHQAKVLVDATNQPSCSPDASNESKKPNAESPSQPDLALSSDTDHVWSNLGALGSGYPADPNTVAFLKRTLDPVFGWPGLVRFSWATAKTMLEEKVKPVTAHSAKPVLQAALPPLSRGKRLTRSLSSTCSLASDISAATPDSQPQTSQFVTSPTRAVSIYGTILPQPAIPGGMATRGYKVKWIDEPVSISKFFASTSGGAKKANAAATAASSATAVTQEDDAFKVSPLQTAVNAWLKTEAQKATATAAHRGQVQINVTRLTKDLGLVGANACFCL